MKFILYLPLLKKGVEALKYAIWDRLIDIETNYETFDDIIEEYEEVKNVEDDIIVKYENGMYIVEREVY